MCGLAGVFAKYVTDKHRKVFQELMLGASLRGMHSAGIASVTKAYNAKDADYVFDKCVGNPLNLFERKAADSVLKASASKALIGHCRSATIGSISRANAHPFQTDSRMMIGCHNGTIRGKQPNEEFYGTDSECLLNNIDEHGIENVLPETLGAWALTYFDSKNNTLNLIRNKERTLYVASVVKDNALFWASEGGLLRWILDRNDIKYDEGIYLLKPNTLITVDVTKDEPLAKSNLVYSEINGKEESRNAASNINFPQGRTQSWDNETSSWKIVESRTQTSPTTEQKQAQQLAGSALMIPARTTSQNEDQTQSPKTNGVMSNGDNGHSKNTVTGINELFGNTEIPLTHHTYGGKRVSRAKFQDILNMGCVNCEKVKRIGDEVHFFADNVYLCQECHDVPMVRSTVATRIGEYVSDEYDTQIEAQFEQTCN